MKLHDLSFKMHGAWVFHKGFGRDRIGRISYYDSTTKQVWVMWEPGKIQVGDVLKTMKTQSASGHDPKELTYLKHYEHSKWIDEDEVQEAYKKRTE